MKLKAGKWLIAAGLLTATALECLSANGLVRGWGFSRDGKATPPANASNAVAVAAGYHHSLALKGDGTVVGWGSNGDNFSRLWGQADVPHGLSNVIAVSAQVYSSLALKSDGTCVAWGGPAGNPPFPLSNIVAIAAGGWCHLALLSSGTVVGWGYDFYGQTSIPPDLSNVVAIAAGGGTSALGGGGHGLALKRDGTVVAWGKNDYGQATVPPGLSNVIAIAAGANHSLALRKDGTVVGWGYDRASSVPSGLTNVIAVAGGVFHSLALKNDGMVIDWTLGATNTVSGITDVVGLAAGLEHSLTVAKSGPGPEIIMQPGSQIVYSGATLNLGFVPAFGQPPLHYQWTFNSTNLAGATSMFLRMDDVQANDSGDYGVIVSNSHGSVMTSNIHLTVLTSPPIIAVQPQSQSLLLGTNPVSTQFRVEATGSMLLTYQWLFNGVTIPGATNSVLGLADLHAGNSGEYTVVITNTYGALTSAPAQLTFPPTIHTQPMCQMTAKGSNATFSIAAAGSLPLTYVWRFNGLQIPNASAASLTIENVQSADEGNYDVVITNAFGSVTSAPVILNAMDIAEAAGPSDLSWSSRGDAPWYWQTAVTHDGVAAARSGAIGGDQTSTLETTVTGPGTLTYWWKVSSRSLFHRLTFSVNGVQQGQISGEVDWQLKTDYLGEGLQTIKWTYSKNSFAPEGQDAAWLDEVAFEPGETPPTITTFPASRTVAAGADVIFNAVAIGTPRLHYQWQLGGTNIGNPTNRLVLTNVQARHQGTYRLIVTNAAGSVTSSNLSLTVTSSPPVILVQPANQFNPAGSNVTFSVTARGSEPVTFQWQFNSNTIAGATNSALGITNLQPSHVGNYRVLISNAHGSIISSNATLTLVDIDALAAALDAPELSWTTSGDAPWFAQTNITRDEVDATQTAPIAYGQTARLRTTVVGPGTLTFWYRNTSYDYLTFTHRSGQALLGTSFDWQQRTFYLSDGEQTLQWNFRRDYWAGDSLQNIVWLDQVSFVPGNTPATIISASTNATVPAGIAVTLNVNAAGTPPLNYQWRSNGAVVPGATRPWLNLTNVQSSDSGTYSVTVTNAYGASTTNIILTVQPMQFALGLTHSGVTTNGMLLSLQGLLGTNTWVVHASTNLVTWLPIMTNPPATGSLQILDRVATNFPRRFYRVERR